MGLSPNGRNKAVDGVTAVALYMSLHSADPSTTGANELAGGSPAYARKAMTWPGASGGSSTASNQPQFDIPAGATISHFGVWSALTTGTFYGGAALSSSETYGAQGIYTVTSATVTVT